MNFVVTIDRKALKALVKIEQSDRRRIEDTIEALGDNPRPEGVKMLKGHHGTYRVRAGNYRILYVVDDTIRIVNVTNIGRRDKIYKEV